MIFTTTLDCYKDRTLVAAKFTLDAAGKVKSINVLGSISDSVKHALGKMIQQTSGYWEPRRINGKPVDSQPILLPIYFILAGCEFKSKTGLDEWMDRSIIEIFSLGAESEDCLLLSIITVTSYAEQEIDPNSPINR